MSEIGLILPQQDHNHSPFRFTQPDQKQNHVPIPSSLMEATKSCSSCTNTKTSLWRSGPNGPKSLCNACYLKNRKRKKKMIKKWSEDERKIEAAAETLVLMSASRGGFKHIR
ncbi:hypothetical protein ACHQM5_029988 [Ranunculus cassubicifolius]